VVRGPAARDVQPDRQQPGRNELRHASFTTLRNRVAGSFAPIRSSPGRQVSPATRSSNCAITPAISLTTSFGSGARSRPIGYRICYREPWKRTDASGDQWSPRGTFSLVSGMNGNERASADNPPRVSGSCPLRGVGVQVPPRPRKAPSDLGREVGLRGDDFLPGGHETGIANDWRSRLVGGKRLARRRGHRSGRDRLVGFRSAAVAAGRRADPSEPAIPPRRRVRTVPHG
jgi:hypothetical protein